jgi:hypothetical protein
MEQDIGKALTYQIKKEIAERYFGYRKFIEEDRQALEAMIPDLHSLYEQKIGRDIVRIYVLLRDLDLIDEFLRLAGWEGRPFFDQYIVESETIRGQLLKNMELHGWMPHSRFTNLLLDSYERLYLDIFEYRKKLDEVLEEAKVIDEEIRQFKEKFSLGEIMGFLKTLDRRDDLTGVLGENLPGGEVEDLSSRLDLAPIGDLERILPKVLELPAPNKVKSSLKDLARRAVKAHKKEVLKAVRN